MTEAFTSQRGLHVERGGAGERLLVLLHGMGANTSVWTRLKPFIEAQWDGRWLAPDFRGHGRSLCEGPYGYGVHAADIASLMAEESAADVTLLGHSFGGLVAALIGSGWFGIKPRRVATVGVKIVWTADEIEKALDVSRRPARGFDTRAEAIERALKVAGLFGLMDPHSPAAGIGVRERDGKFWLAFDQRATGGVGPSVETILKLCAAPLRLAAGVDDPMVALADMQRIDPAAVAISDAGHNAHWEAPEAVWRFFEEGEASFRDAV